MKNTETVAIGMTKNVSKKYVSVKVWKPGHL